MIAINLSSSFGQKKSKTENEIYNTWIKLNDNKTYEGTLVEIRKDAIVILDNNIVDRTFDFGSNLQTFELRKKESISKGIIIGALSGAAIGGAIGYIGARPSPGEWDFQQEATMVLGLGGGIIGGLIGGLIGAAKIKININGNQNLNNEQLRKLKMHNLLTP